MVKEQNQKKNVYTFKNIECNLYYAVFMCIVLI